MLEELQKKYLASLEEKSETIKSLWEQFLQGDKSVLEEIRRHAHSLKGSGATFGFPEISEAGRQLEAANDTDLLNSLNALLNIIGRVTANKRSSNSIQQEQAGNDIHPSRDALIIQRNPDNAKVIANCIQKLELVDKCIIANTGADAKKYYSRNRYALIVLDLVLPDKDGREILREIKRLGKNSSPVLVISGIASDSIYLECMAFGADQYLSKPFDTDKLFFEAQQLTQPNYLQVVSTSKVSGKSQSKSAELKGVNILVAEDDELQGLFIAQKLGEQGAEVTVVENGQLALDALQNNNFSAVILDGLMPVMDGFQTLESIRVSPRLKGIPVIMVTAMGSEENISRGFALGANDYILKPFSEEQLVSRIKSMLVMAA